jgi:hypothetical protein
MEVGIPFAMRVANSFRQVSMIKYRVSTFLLFLGLFILLTPTTIKAQKKAFDAAVSEAANTDGVSVTYNRELYLTFATLELDVRDESKALKKSFKEFEWKLESWFADKGIDSKPVRVVFCLNTKSKRFVFRDDKNLTLTFNNQDILLGEGQRTSVYKGSARETVCWEVDKIIVEEFAVAASAAFSIAGVNGPFSSESLSKFRAYGQLVDVGQKPR